MRTILFIIMVSACATSSATGPRPVNVAAIRHEIDETIQAQAHDRRITSMGHVTDDSAVIYTTRPSGERQEETWVRSGGAWKLDHSTPFAGATTSSNRS